MQAVIHVFLSSVMKISKAEVTKWVRDIHYENRLMFSPFLCAPEAIF